MSQEQLSQVAKLADVCEITTIRALFGFATKTRCRERVLKACAALGFPLPCVTYPVTL